MNPRSGKRRRIVRWVAVVLAAGAVVWFVVQRALGPHVPVAVAKREPLVHKVIATGRVMPPAKIRLGSTMVATVEQVTVQEGDRVKPGQLLVQLQSDGAKASVAQARAGLDQAEAKRRMVSQVTSRLALDSLRQAEANLDRAERQFQRIEQLVQSGAEPQEQLDEARRTVENARSQAQSATTQVQSAGPSGSEFLLTTAAVAQARAALMGAEAKLADTQIVSSCEGTVLSRTVEPGDVVQPGYVMMILARDGPTRLQLQPDEKNLAYLRLGQTAFASADAFPDERFMARVSFISPAVDPERGTIEVRLDVERPPPTLRTDMTVSVEVQVGRRADAIVLPVDAVRDAATDHPWVMVVRNGRLEKRPVRVGIRGDSIIEIVDGLSPGEAAVPLSAGPLIPGQRVRLKQSTAEVASAL